MSTAGAHAPPRAQSSSPAVLPTPRNASLKMRFIRSWAVIRLRNGSQRTIAMLTSSSESSIPLDRVLGVHDVALGRRRAGVGSPRRGACRGAGGGAAGLPVELLGELVAPLS